MAIARLAIAAVALVLVAAAALPMLAAGAYADCYDYCFKDCISKDKSMRDYCSYACDKTCAPDAAAEPRRPAAGAFACQVDCVRTSCHGVRADGKDMEECYGQCYDGCETKAGIPRPLRAGAVRPAALPDHPFHEKQDNAVQPTGEPDPDDVSHQAWGNALP
ncbi:unnamed protein product [Urochloa decumbens]|uniref:Uncharacterized protein n=1 Tax=Urochloa decumbens TaxID=240449 RepID=A0ABC8ZN66_9POAL